MIKDNDVYDSDGPAMKLMVIVDMMMTAKMILAMII